MTAPRNHGGGLDAAIARFGGTRANWLDLSTGINPVPYPVGEVANEAWTALPDTGAMDRMLSAARRFWNVPEGAKIIAAPGASALIARMPELVAAPDVHIPGPTYNEHEAAFRHAGKRSDEASPVRVLVHPNNPDGRLWYRAEVMDGHKALTIIDESFCDVVPDRSHVAKTATPGIVVLKSFGKFWGLAGLRLGFAIGTPKTLSNLAESLGPWPVSGPALEIGARALEDTAWAQTTRTRLTQDATKLDALMTTAGGQPLGGTTLFRLYKTENAQTWQTRLAEHRIWSRTFPYSRIWLRLGLPAPDRWDQLETALNGTAGGARLPEATSVGPAAK
ncbi:MAG: pyridoxal phosphate-dependent class II aminotransferase [Rhodobacter sp.]|nr:pyridoxal phosphate-dependent class II aminotransferase [Rhodobacter sp.]